MNIKKVSFRKFWDSGDYSSHRKELLLLILVVDINCHVCAGMFSAADRCFPRARLQPPQETHSAGSSDTCCSRRSQRSSAPNNHHNIVLIEHYSTVAKHHVSEGNTRRLLRESEDAKTPQRAFFASEEAHREPAESVVYFRSVILCLSL